MRNPPPMLLHYWMKEDEEKKLIEACARGEIAAQKQLYMCFHKKMMGVCRRYLRDEAEAYMVMNDAFMKVFEKISTFRSEGVLEGWIRRVVVNEVISYLRRNKRYRKSFISEEEMEYYDLPEEMGYEKEEGWWDRAMNIPQEVLLEMVNQLPPASGMVFNLYAIDQYTHREIAEKLKISEGTSKWHLAQARRILQQKVRELIGESEQDKRKGYEEQGGE